MKQPRISPLTNAEISAFCGQLSMILQAGISSVEGIMLLLEESETAGEQALLRAIQQDLGESGSLYTALSATRAFPAYLLQMVKIGEETGKVDTVFAALATHYDREAALAQSIKNAVTYPMIMVVMMVLVILLLITRVMPIFSQVFRQLGTEMTGLSKALLDFGTSINRYSILLVALLAVLVLAVLYFAKTARGRRQFSRLAARLPWLHGLTDKIAAGRLASGLYLTLSSGLSPEAALEMTEKLTDNTRFLKRVAACKEKLAAGESLAPALLETKIFTGLYARMTAIGAKTGAVDEIMDQIANKYNEEIDRRFTNVIATLEPTLVIILSLIVGLILLSVMLPLISILSSI